MKSKPFIIKADKTGQALEPIQPDQNLFPESWLQERLHNHPQILPVDEFEPIFWPLVPIGREIATAVGYIDNLFISEAGYPVLVETKLWRNSQARREVIAQALDYAGELSKWTFEEFDAASLKINGKGVIDLIQEAFDPDPDKCPTEDTIAKNLRLGRFLILIVGDRIRSSLKSMLAYINKFPHLATNVGLVELHCYQMPGDFNDIMVVPSVVAKTEIIERSIVQVILEPDRPHQISVEQTRKEDDGKQGRILLTEEVFWEKLKQQSPASASAMRQIYDHYQDHHPLLYFQMRQSGIVIRMNCPDSDQAISLLILYQAGTIEFWPGTIKNQLEKAGLDPKMGDQYELALSKIIRGKSKSRANYYPVEKVEREELFRIVDDFIDKISKSAAAAED
jgi:hypothetical protein